MTATFAVVVDGLIEDAGGHVEAVELEKTGILQQDDVDEHGHDPLGVNRAAGHVDHGRVDADLTQVLLDAHGVRRIPGERRANHR